MSFVVFNQIYVSSNYNSEQSLIFPPLQIISTLSAPVLLHPLTCYPLRTDSKQYCIPLALYSVYPGLISKRELEFKTQFAAIRWAVIYGCKRSWRGDLVTRGSLRPGPPTQPETMVEIVPHLSARARWCKRHFKDGSFERSRGTFHLAAQSLIPDFVCFLNLIGTFARNTINTFSEPALPPSLLFSLKSDSM